MGALGRHQAYATCSKRCSLCLNETLKIVLYRDNNMVNRRTEILNKCRHKNKYALISHDTKDERRFLLKVSMKRYTQNYCFQESGWLPFPVARQITGHTDFPWKHFAKTLMWRHIMQKIPWYCKLTFYSFGWRLLLCQDETLGSKSVVFFVSKHLKYIYIYMNEKPVCVCVTQ